MNKQGIYLDLHFISNISDAIATISELLQLSVQTNLSIFFCLTSIAMHGNASFLKIACVPSTSIYMYHFQCKFNTRTTGYFSMLCTYKKSDEKIKLQKKKLLAPNIIPKSISTETMCVKATSSDYCIRVGVGKRKTFA